MLIVGDRVHAVERVWHVDETALPLDLSDGLFKRHPSFNLLGDEKADHLALACRLDLLAKDHLDAVLLADRGRRDGARDFVVLGHGDGAEAAVAGRL